MILSKRILLALWAQLNKLAYDATSVEAMRYWKAHRDRLDALCKARGWFD